MVQNTFKFMMFILAMSYSSNLLAQGEHLYNDKIIHEIRFRSPKSSSWSDVVNNYENEKKDYVRFDIEIDGTKLKQVGLRIKGGRLNKFPNRPKFESLKVDINEFEKDQVYDGLKKLNIKNRNIVANHLLYKLARKLHVPSCRTSFTKVYFDDEYIGSYLLIEQIDKTYLKQHFGDKKGNLYKASGKGATLSYLGEDVQKYKYPYEKKTNEKKADYTDLLTLLKFISHAPTHDFETNIEAKLSLEDFLRALALEMFVNKRDAFYDAGRNYYLYNDLKKTKLFHYIVDDFDYTFSDRGEYTSLNFDKVQSDVQPFVGSDLIKQIMQSERIKQMYYHAVAEVLEHVGDLEKELDRIENLTIGQDFALYDFLDFKTQNTSQILKAFLQKRKSELKLELKQNQYNPTFVRELSNANIKVFPTVFNDKLIVKGESVNEQLFYSLFDMRGNCVKSGYIFGCLEIQGLGTLPPASYLLKVSSSQESKTFYIIRRPTNP